MFIQIVTSCCSLTAIYKCFWFVLMWVTWRVEACAHAYTHTHTHTHTHTYTHTHTTHTPAHTHTHTHTGAHRFLRLKQRASYSAKRWRGKTLAGKNIGGGKHWRIWQLSIDPPKFSHPNIVNTLKCSGKSAQFAKVLPSNYTSRVISPKFHPTNILRYTVFHLWLWFAKHMFSFHLATLTFSWKFSFDKLSKYDELCWFRIVYQLHVPWYYRFIYKYCQV